MSARIVFPAVLLIAAQAVAQNPGLENDLPLSTGFDTIVTMSAPSVGFPTGTNPPDTVNGDFYWKVFPKEVLNYGGTQTMEISGIELEIYDSDWSTPPPYYDLLLTRGVDSGSALGSGVSPGNIEPDFTDPNQTFISLGFANFPDPCSVNPALGCVGGCPPMVGQVLGYNVDIQFGTGNGTGIIINADGTEDLVVSAFAPGGMSTQGGPCGGGDYSYMYAFSTLANGGFGEGEPDWLGTGYSAYGGIALSGQNLLSDLVGDTPVLALQFFEPTMIVGWNDGTLNAPDDGLVGLHPPVGSGNATLSLRMYDLGGIGNTALFSASITPPVAGAGLALPGGGFFKLDLLDPVVQFLITFPSVIPSGTVLFENNGGAPFDNGVFETIPVAAPASFAGSTLHFQGLNFAPSASGLLLRTTNVYTVTFF